MASTTTRRKPAYPVPQSLNEAARLGEALQAQRLAIELERQSWEEVLQAATASRDRALEPLLETEAEIAAALTAFCEARRAELTNGGRKQSAQVGPVRARWRQSNAVTIADEAGLIDWIRQRQDPAYLPLLKVSTKVAKAAIVRRPEMAAGLPGVTIEARETFELVTGPVETVQSEPAAAPADPPGT